MNDDLDQAAIEANFRQWLAEGGEERIKAAMQRARKTSQQFAENTRVDWRTLYEPIGPFTPLPLKPGMLQRKL